MSLQPDSRITKREADPDYYRPINLDDNHPLELKKCNADVSKCCPARVNWSRRSSCRCSLVHCLSQWVPLNNTYKKVFGLHLSKTTSFLVIQIVQHKADAAVNNNKLCMLPPALDQLTNKSSMLWGVISQTLSVQRAIGIWHNNIEKRGVEWFLGSDRSSIFCHHSSYDGQGCPWLK